VILRELVKRFCELRQAQALDFSQFNKIDLYPDTDRQSYCQNLRQIAAGGGTHSHSQIKVIDVHLPDEIVMVAAELPLEVRVNGPMVKLLGGNTTAAGGLS